MPVDEFTTALLELAFQTAPRRYTATWQRTDQLSLQELLQAVSRHWRNYREGQIAVWSAQLLLHTPPLALLADYARVQAALEALDELPGAWPVADDPEAVEAVAWGQAVLFWQELAQRVTPNYTEEEAAAWLQQRLACSRGRPVQLALFAATAM